MQLNKLPQHPFGVDLCGLGTLSLALAEARDIVAYCRGPYCVLSFEAIAALRGRGVAVRRLVDGYPEWKAAGRPVETARTA